MITPTTSPAYDLLSHTLAFCDDCLNRQDYTAAWQALCRAVSMAPNRTDVLIHRGHLALYLKDTESARADFAAALKIDPRCSAALSGLARYYMQQGEPIEAEAAADRALGIDPADEEAAQLKAEIQEERCKARPRELSRMNSQSASGEREGCVRNEGVDLAPEFADRQVSAEARLSNCAARLQPSEVDSDDRPLYMSQPSQMDAEMPVLEQLRIENTNLCAFKCGFCPREKMDRPQGIQSVDNFKLVLDRVEEYGGAFAHEVHLHGYGDPLLDKDLPKKTSLCAARWPKASPVIISTLGYVVSPDYLRSLVEGGLRRIYVSFYGSDPRSYLWHTGVDRFHVAYQNLMVLAELKRNHSHRLAITVQTCLTGLNSTLDQPNKGEFNHALSDLGMEVVPFPLHNYGNGREYEKGPGMLCERAIRRNILTITWDLKVTPCSYDYNSSIVLGNLETESLRNILTNGASSGFLANHCAGNADVYNICRNCSRRTWLAQAKHVAMNGRLQPLLTWVRP